MDKQTRRILTWSELKLAVFISIVIALAVFSIFFSGLVGSIFKQQIDLIITIDNVGGLRPGAPVWLQGVEIGTVQKVGIRKASEYIDIRIGREFQPFLYHDSYAQIKAVGLLGSKYVELVRGKDSSRIIQPGQNIKGSLVDPLKDLNKDISIIVSHLSTLTRNIDSGNGVAGTLVQDTSLASNMKASVSTVRSLLEEFKKNPKKFINIKIF